jgi:hypothetical protein
VTEVSLAQASAEEEQKHLECRSTASAEALRGASCTKNFKRKLELPETGNFHSQDYSVAEPVYEVTSVFETKRLSSVPIQTGK